MNNSKTICTTEIQLRASDYDENQELYCQDIRMYNNVGTNFS